MGAMVAFSDCTWRGITVARNHGVCANGALQACFICDEVIMSCALRSGEFVGSTRDGDMARKEVFISFSGSDRSHDYFENAGRERTLLPKAFFRAHTDRGSSLRVYI